MERTHWFELGTAIFGALAIFCGRQCLTKEQASMVIDIAAIAVKKSSDT